MFLIDDVLVSREIFKRKFVCNLSACKGACCWEGDWGAPLDNDEREILTEVRNLLRPYLSDEGNELIDRDGPFTYYPEPGKYGTPLQKDGACAYLTVDDEGVAQCGIEKAWADGAIEYKKPVSCHLYPLRFEVQQELSFKALNYDEWDICAAACELGESLNVPVYQFVKEALIRRFGESFYQHLEDIARDIEEGEDKR